MKKLKFLLSLIVAAGLLIVQVGGALAAPARQGFPSISGIVQSITIETDSSTGIITVLVSVISTDQNAREVRISQQAAEKLGLIVFNGDGKPIINSSALGKSVEIKLKMIIPDQEEHRHPVGNALATFFSDIADEETLYQTIMEAHAQGVGFGVIAQALWMTQQMPDGNLPEIRDQLAMFNALLLAKEENNYEQFSDFLLEDGSSPMNWGQLRKAILHPTPKSPDQTLSSQNNGSNTSSNENIKDKAKEKDKGNTKEKSNNGNGNGNKP